MSLKVIVIGAGMAGLSCAYELQKAGLDVLVLEREHSVGGRLSSRHKQGLSFDLGAQMVSRSYASVLAYCRELGIEERWNELTGLAHHTYYEGKFHQSSYASLGQFLRYSYLNPVARARLLFFITALGVKARHIDFFDLATGVQFDQQNAYDFALKWAGQEVADQVVDTLVGAYHFHSSKDMSLSAFLGCLNHFTRYFTFHHMIPDMNALPKALANRLDVLTSSPVSTVIASEKGATVYIESDQLTCDCVVFATPGNVTRSLYTTPSVAQKALLETVQYAATVVVSFRIPTASIPDVSLVIVPESESLAICSYLLPSKCQNSVDQTQEMLVNVFLRDDFACQIMNKTDEEIFNSVRDELMAVCPPLRDCKELITSHDLQRWPCAMPKFFPSYVSQVKAFWENGQGNNQVYFSGDFLNTPWVEGSVRCGQRTATHLMKQVLIIEEGPQRGPPSSIS